MSWACLIYSLIQTWSQLFFLEALVPQIQNGFRKHSASRDTHYSWIIVVLGLFQWAKLDFIFICVCVRASLVTQTVKRLPTMWETCVQSLGREDPLEKEMGTHSSTLSWKIPYMEEPGGLQCMGSQRVGHD